MRRTRGGRGPGDENKQRLLMLAASVAGGTAVHNDQRAKTFAVPPASAQLQSVQCQLAPMARTRIGVLTGYRMAGRGWKLERPQKSDTSKEAQRELQGSRVPSGEKQGCVGRR